MTVFILVLFTGTFSTIFGLPGTVIIFVDVILYALATGFHHIGFMLIVIMLMITLLAEALDFSLGMAGAARFVPSKKNLWAAAAGALLGGMIMTPLLYGLGTVSGAFLGGFCGVLTVELLRQNRLKPTLRMSSRAFMMGIAGVFVKGFSALAMTIAALANIYS
jgi:uncharacterized protein YqgC (DUF456 family)